MILTLGINTRKKMVQRAKQSITGLQVPFNLIYRMALLDDDRIHIAACYKEFRQRLYKIFLGCTDLVFSASLLSRRSNIIFSLSTWVIDSSIFLSSSSPINWSSYPSSNTSSSLDEAAPPAAGVGSGLAGADTPDTSPEIQHLSQHIENWLQCSPKILPPILIVQRQN